MFQKEIKWRSKQYTDWVKSLDSCLSMMPADDPHHIINVLFSGKNNKPHDLFTIPLTRREHTYLHDKGGRNWEREMQISQAEEVIKTIDKAINQGLIDINWVDG